MSNNVSEFPGRKSGNFDSDTNRNKFYDDLSKLINDHGNSVSTAIVVTALETVKIDLLTRGTK